MSRTKKITVLASALVATVAFYCSTAAATNQVVLKSSISIKFRGGGTGDYVEQATFLGKVKAKHKHGHGHNHRAKPAQKNLKKRCVKDRRVVIVHKRNGAVLRKTDTDRKGKYAVPAGVHFVPGDRYLAQVKKKTFRKGHTKVVCKQATSKTITAG